MKEGKSGVKRLLTAIYNNIDEHNATTLAYLLHYDKTQLLEDIEEIQKVEIKEKD